MSAIYKIREWNPNTGNIGFVSVSYEQIIRNPYRLNAIDIAEILINKLRAERGLEPLDSATFDAGMFKE